MNSVRLAAGGILALTASLYSVADTETEIEYLLDFVSGSGCMFERNGTEHEAADAADHLRLKYSRGKRYVNSAEQFIDRLASESSWSGRKYTVTCGDTTELSGDWLHRALDEHREGRS